MAREILWPVEDYFALDQPFHTPAHSKKKFGCPLFSTLFAKPVGQKEEPGYFHGVSMGFRTRGIAGGIAKEPSLVGTAS